MSDAVPDARTIPTSEVDTELERAGPEPLHEQISARIRKRITDGEWAAHYKLPIEPELALAFSVSRGTIRRALRTLIEERLLVQVRGKGTFVTISALEQSIAQELLSLAEGMQREGVQFVTEVLAREVVEPPPRVAGLLGLGEQAAAFRLERRRLVDGAAVAYLVNYVRRDLCPGIEHIDFRSETLFGVIERDFGRRITSGRRTFAAEGADDRVARQLEVEPGAPVLYLEQVACVADGTPIEYSDVWMRGDRLKLSSVLRRG